MGNIVSCVALVEIPNQFDLELSPKQALGNRKASTIMSKEYGDFDGVVSNLPSPESIYGGYRMPPPTPINGYAMEDNLCVDMIRTKVSLLSNASSTEIHPSCVFLQAAELAKKRELCYK